MILTQGANSINRYPMYVDGPTIGGRKYSAVKIGSLVWLAENLDYKGSIAFNTTDSLTEPRCCYYDNQSVPPFDSYGLYYNYPAVKYINDAILQDGWRVPTVNDFNDLCENTGGTPLSDGGLGAFTGCAINLKSKTAWVNGPNYGNGNDKYGYNAFPSGRKFGKSFSGLGEHFNNWLINVVDSENSCRADIYYDANNYAYYKTKNDRMASLRLCRDI